MTWAVGLDMTRPGAAISDVIRPTLVGGVDLIDAVSVVLDGDMCYVAGDSHITYVDISDKANPVAGANNWFSTPLGYSWSILKEGPYCYTASGDGYFAVTDVTTPVPTVVSSLWLNPNFQMFDIVKVGDYCYLTNSQGSRLYTVNVTNPLAPVSLGYVDGSVNFVEPYGMAYANGHLTVVSEAKVTTFTLSNPAVPVIVDSLDLAPGIFPYYLIQEDGIAYFTAYISGDDGVLIVDVSDPTDISLISYVRSEFMFSPYGLTKVGNYLYVMGNTRSNITTIDISNLSIPRVVDSTALANTTQIRDIETDGSYLYAINGGGNPNLSIWSLSG